MKKNDAALRPSFSVRDFIQEKKTEDIKTLTNDEKVLAAGAGNAFWKILKKHFDNSIEQLEEINEAAIANGASSDQIGENTIVISYAKGVIRKIANIVEDAREMNEEANGQG